MNQVVRTSSEAALRSPTTGGVRGHGHSPSLSIASPSSGRTFASALANPNGGTHRKLSSLSGDTKGDSDSPAPSPMLRGTSASVSSNTNAINIPIATSPIILSTLDENVTKNDASNTLTTSQSSPRNEQASNGRVSRPPTPPPDDTDEVWLIHYPCICRLDMVN
jgi:hypothetical protein